MNNTIAREIARTLKSSGVNDFFMLTGGDQPLWIALRDEGIRMLVARSEPGAVYMADGFARARNAPAVTYGQAGPGAANVAAALADAYWAQSPVVALTGANATNAMHVNEYQSLDQFAMFAPVTKWNARVASPSQAALLTRLALQTAASGTPGPTHLDVPKDFFGLAAGAHQAALDAPWPKAHPVPPDADDIAAIAQALRRAERPLVLAGDGMRAPGAAKALLELATAAGWPVACTMGGKGTIPSDHPNFIGIVGRYSSATANAIAAKADCVLALGTRLGGLATNGWRLPSPQATVLQIDRDPQAFVNPYAPALTACADLELALRALLTETAAPSSAQAAWSAHCRDAMRPGERRCRRSPCSPRSSVTRPTPCWWRTPATWPPGPACSIPRSVPTPIFAPRARSAGRSPRRWACSSRDRRRWCASRAMAASAITWPTSRPRCAIGCPWWCWCSTTIASLSSTTSRSIAGRAT